MFLLTLVPRALSAQAAELLQEARKATPTRQAEIADRLKRLPLTAFDPAAATELGLLLRSPDLAAAPTYVKLVGFIQREDLLAGLAEPLAERQDVRRAVNLARVRSGNPDRRDNLLKNLRAIEVTDDFAYVVVPLLVYTRDRAVFDYLWEQVMTENKNCHPADAETGGRIDCAYRIVEQLAGAIADFPVAADEDGNLLTADYAGALAEIRRWYAANAATYSILTETF